MHRLVALRALSTWEHVPAELVELVAEARADDPDERVREHAAQVLARRADPGIVGCSRSRRLRPHPLRLGRPCAENPAISPNLVVDACHDLRTPLAAAFGFARTIERMGGVTGDNAMYLQQVIEATQELEQLIAALSAVAHGERGTLRLRPQPVDLGELALRGGGGQRPRARARRDAPA